MSEGRYDRILNIIESRAGRINQKMTKEFKGKQPFDTVKMSNEELVAQYIGIPDEVKAQLRQQMPNFAQVENRILKKMEGMK